MNPLRRVMLALLNRRAKKTLDEVVNRLPLRKETAVADIGCGGGIYTLEFADRIGERGEVYAVDVKASHLAYTREKVRKAGLAERLTLVLAETDDSLLPEASVDLAFSRNSYHHIKDPVRYFGKIGKALKPGGTLAIIDYNDSPGSGHRHAHSTSPEEIRRDLADAGFKYKTGYDMLPGQSFQIFERTNIGLFHRSGTLL